VSKIKRIYLFTLNRVGIPNLSTKNNGKRSTVRVNGPLGKTVGYNTLRFGHSRWINSEPLLIKNDFNIYLQCSVVTGQISVKIVPK